MAELKFINDPSRKDGAYTDQVDALSLRIYHLNNVTQLAAFAAEARRALGAFEVITEGRPEMQAAIGAEMKYPNAWRDYDDVSGEVLQWVARQLDGVSTEMTDAAYSTAKGDPA